MVYETVRDAAMAWVEGFDAIPQALIAKLARLDPGDVTEVTPPLVGDMVFVPGIGEGKITEYNAETDDYTVRLENGKVIRTDEDDLSVERYKWLPIWGTMWSFGDRIDEEWLDGEHLGSHLREMAECGFRIYEQADLGHVFGIDGAGYDFYEAHWIPLYQARGLKWHKEDDNQKDSK